MEPTNYERKRCIKGIEFSLDVINDHQENIRRLLERIKEGLR